MGSFGKLTVKTLKHVAFLTGGTAASKKSELVDRVSAHLSQPLFSPSHGRILSIDMGIRNLAYCVIEPIKTRLPQQSDASLARPSDQLGIAVTTWNRLDLLEQLRSTNGLHSSSDTADHDAASTTESGTFSPANVSTLAYEVCKSLLDYKPDVILIEQQRFRSSGGSAIQEWTVRVNMLESMLWACFETIKQTNVGSSIDDTTVHSVSPARVAKFWVTGQSSTYTAADLLDDPTQNPDAEIKERSKITKQDKIKVLESWVEQKHNEPVTLSFSDQAALVAERFRTSTGRRRAAGDMHGKRDDLTDCLLQGAAWMAWERNRQMLQPLLFRT